MASPAALLPAIGYSRRRRRWGRGAGAWMTMVPHICVSTCLTNVAPVGKWNTSPDDREEAAKMYLVLTEECISRVPCMVV